MALIKRDNAKEAAKDAVVLDLSDLGRQAERLKEEAQAKADQIVQEAEQRARELVEGADQRGYDQGYQRGYDAGFETGKEQGRAEALQQQAEQLQQLQQVWTEALQQWEGDSARLQREAQQQVLQLARRLAEKVLHRQIAVDPSIVEDQLAHALSHVMRPIEVTVTIHPDDRPAVEEALPELVQQLSNVGQVELVEDPSMMRGGCRVRYGQGTIDASIETQLDRLVETILPKEARPWSSENAPAASQDAALEARPAGETVTEAGGAGAAASEPSAGDGEGEGEDTTAS